MKTNILKYGRTVIRILVLFFTLYLPLTHIYSNENKISYKTSNNDSNKFMVGIINNGVENAGKYDLLTDSLLCNTWHRYGKWSRGPNWFQGDSLNANINVYQSEIQSVIDDNRNHNMRTLFMREKLLYLCFGQRSDYQCEASGFDNDLLPYTYKTHNTGEDFQDNSSFGNNNWVRYCSTIPSYGHTQGYVCKELRANREQINVHPNWGEYAVDGLYKWYVKPRIRIDTAYANNPINFYNNICRIEVLNFVGDTILNKDLLVSDFRGDLDSIYHGNYKESFERNNLNILEIDTNKKFNPTNEVLWNDTGKVDFRVYWYGQCNMWIDYVRVENQIAYDLFNHNYDNTWLDWEVKQIASSNSDNIDRFYIEEFEFNQIPCMKYVSDYIKSENQNFSLMFDINIPTYSAHKEDFWNYYGASHIKKFLYDPIQPKEVFSFSYPLLARYIDQKGDSVGIHYIPSTLPGMPGKPLEFNPLNQILAVPTSPSAYDTYLNNLLEYEEGENNRVTMRTLDELSKTTNLPLIFMPQGHLVYWQYHQRKEPTNEELALLTYLGLAYGAKGILHYSYSGSGCTTIIANDTAEIGYDRGFYNPISDDGDSCGYFGQPRYKNAYGQNKWTNVKEVNKHLVKWGDYLLKFNISSRRSYSYGYETDRNDLINNSYFNDVLTYKLSVGAIPCAFSSPDSLEIRTSILQECKEDRFVQVGLFDINAESRNKYFMIVNRRCSPFIDETSHDNNGGRRLIKVQFDSSSSSFSGNNNWVIKDIYKDSIVAKFDKRELKYIDLGWFMPAEARLYKISPLIEEGGTLVADETISGNVNCYGMIYNGGHNITISPNTTVTFSDSAGIEMNGGTFTCGDYNSESPVNLIGLNNSNVWKGLVLENCTSVGIYNTSISRIKDDNVCKAVLISNCNNINIKASTFNVGTNAAAVNAAFTSNSEEPVSFNVSECNFVMGGSGNDALYITSNGASSIPVIIDWCTFTTENENSNALRLINVTGGAVKNSTFVNFKTTINTFGSVIDVYNNKILGRTSSTGILCTDGSSISMKPVTGLYLGGFNYIKNYGSSSSCINTDNSIFNINFGQNDFDLSDLDNSKFFTGTFGGNEVSNVDAVKNCFHKDSITNVEANHSVVWDTSNNAVNFTFTGYSCELTPPNDFFVLQYTGYNDTIFYGAGGTGGGINPNKTINIEENTYKSLKDTVNINLRKRNYLTVEDKAKQILTQYPDSLESISMVQKLYMASLNLDSTKIGLTKTFLENLIAANTQNPGLIKRAFYFIQKCKVKLGQYQSALDGFQYIMTQNPYTYEGLVASWDYAATYLLMGTGGSYKGENEEQTEELITPADTLLSRMTKRDINTNKGKSNTTSEQITKIFYEKIKNVTKDDKITQEAKVKTLEKKIETSKNNTEKNDAVSKLAAMKQIKEVVKVKKPNTVMKHIQIMNDDIKKVFGIGKSNNKGSENNLIPKTFTLYQNYPNPFNPTTKIAYDIPRDAKVKLVIYDILGREIKILVNNEFRSAGKYITEFNGSNLASGIYFARILVNEGKDFIAVKKMVLLK